jgi:hypothetical protein
MPKVSTFVAYAVHADPRRLVQDKHRCTLLCIKLSITNSTRPGSDSRALPLWGVTHLILLFYQRNPTNKIWTLPASGVIHGTTPLGSDQTPTTIIRKRNKLKILSKPIRHLPPFSEFRYCSSGNRKPMDTKRIIHRLISSTRTRGRHQ